MNIKKIDSRYIEEILKLDVRFGSTWSKGFYLDRLKLYPDLAYGAFNNGKLIGFVLGKREANGDVLISRLVVKRELEGRGIGGNLVDYLTNKVHNEAKRLKSTVRKSNVRSIKLHEHRNFEILPEVHVYSDGEKGLKFRKRI